MRKNKKPLPYEQALALAASQCAQCERCESDVHAHLIDWGMTEDEANTIMARLKSENYLNEHRFARAYARDKFAFNGWGRQKIAFMLKGKGVSSEAIAEATAAISDDDCRRTLHKLLTAKARSVAKREPRAARAALLRLAASRGFEPNLYFQAVDQIMSGTDSDDYDEFL